MSPAPADPTRPLRIGAVTYLNTVPLVRGLREQLPAAIRALVLDDQRLRNAICWSVFDC